MINFKIITPDGLYKQAETSIINVTSKDGERGILPNHMPVVFMLDIGRLETIENGNKQIYSISGGMFYFKDNEANIIVDTIEAKEDIDLDRAISSRDRQLKKLNSNDENWDIRRAEVSLKKAINRIKIAS